MPSPGLTKLLNALKGSQNKEMIEGIIKEGGEFQEVFQILEGGRHNLSQLEVTVMFSFALFKSLIINIDNVIH